MFIVFKSSGAEVSVYAPDVYLLIDYMEYLVTSGYSISQFVIVLQSGLCYHSSFFKYFFLNRCKLGNSVCVELIVTVTFFDVTSVQFIKNTDVAEVKLALKIVLRR